MRKALDHFGYPFDERMSGGMECWMRENRQHKHGVHRYSLEQFGLSTEQVEAQFADYIARYDVATARQNACFKRCLPSGRLTRWTAVYTCSR